PGTGGSRQQTVPSTGCLSKRPFACSTTRSTHRSLTCIPTARVGTRSGLSVECCFWWFTHGRRLHPQAASQSAGSSAPGKLPRAKGKHMRKATSKPLTRAQLSELKSLAARPDKAIDTSDAPEILDWSGAKRGLFYRPVKQQLTLRLDADVVAWFKHHGARGKGYQTRINHALREYVSERAQKTRRAKRA